MMPVVLLNIKKGQPQKLQENKTLTTRRQMAIDRICTLPMIMLMMMIMVIIKDGNNQNLHHKKSCMKVSHRKSASKKKCSA